MSDDLLRAEAVAFPLASWSGILNEVFRLHCDSEGKADKSNEGLATAFDWHVIQAYGREVASVDQISRLRRSAWYGPVPVEGCDKPLEEYVHDLTKELIEYHQGVTDEGFFLKQDVEPDFWRQLATKISPDLFLAAAALGFTDERRLLGRQTRVKFHTPFLDHTQKLVEQHVHLGACYPFDTLWVQALKHKILLAKDDDEEKDKKKVKDDKARIYKTRGDTQDLRPLLIRAAVARMILIHFLAENLDTSNKLRDYIKRKLEEREVRMDRHRSETYRDALGASNFWRGAEHEGEFLDDERIKDTHHRYLEVLELEAEPLRSEEDNMRGSAERTLNDWLYVRVPDGWKDVPTTAEPFLLYSSLKYLKELPDDEDFRAMFWQLIRCKNLFYQRLVQQENVYGLHYFSWFYNQIGPFTKGPKGKKIRLAEAHLNQSGRLSALELRCGPAADKEEQKEEFRELASAYLELLEKETQEQPLPHWRDRCPRIGLVVHFIKETNTGRPVHGCADKRSADRRHRYEEYFKKVWHQMDACASLLERAPALSHFFRGLDVANLEREIPGWVFAPIFREFRERLEFAVQQDPHFRKLQLTAHLGEDFLHPISGLRRIDEGLEYFEMKTGDRIGHAIALGLDLEEWAKRYKGSKITVPLDEYLDDLAWEWRLYNARQVPAIVDAISFLERDFLRTSDEIFDSAQCSEHEISSVSLRKWAKAYHWRHDTKKLLELGVLTEVDGRVRPCIQQKSEDKESCAEKGQLSEIHRYCEAYLYCEELWREISNAEVEVTIDEHYLQRAQALQEWLQRRFNSKNLIAEICPTSNVVIARLGGYANHPAFQFDDPRSGVDRVRFTVNADDPLTFNTTVEDELSHLYYAMGEFHGDVQRPETWVWKRCKTSTQTSFVVPDTVSLEDHMAAIKEATKVMEA